MPKKNLESMSDEEILQHLSAQEQVREETCGEPGRWDGVTEVVMGILMIIGGIGLFTLGLATGFIVYFAVGIVIAGASVLRTGLKKRLDATWLQ
jgi:hypothetical protein